MILVVEDNEDFLDMLTGNLFYAGEVVNNASDALERLNAQPFTAVFCDVHGIDRHGITAHDVVRLCALTGVLCFITTNDPFAANEFAEKHHVMTVDKVQTYRALIGAKGVA